MTVSGGVSRRRFLQAAGGLLLASAAGTAGAGCERAAAHPPAASPTPTPPSTPLPVTTADWARLAGGLQGSLVLPVDPAYATARQLFNPVFDAVTPAGIAYCASPADVAACVVFGREHGLAVTPRSGGHSYAGYSTGTGLVVDVTRMSSVAVDDGAGTAVIGAGARLIDVYAALAARGALVPAGSCPTVGIAGLTLGGGVGVLSRKYGLTSDSLRSAQVVTAEGRVLTCDETEHADLFWALRGGGGGNFGVVTSLTFATHPAPGLVLFSLEWPWAGAARAISAWQAWVAGAPDELWSNCLLLASAGRKPGAVPSMRIGGVFVGTVAQAQAALAGLAGEAGAPSQRSVHAESFLEAMKTEGGCFGLTVDQCHLPSQNPAGTLTREPFAARSDYLTAPLPAAGVSAAVDAVERRQAAAGLADGGLAFDAYGGAIGRVAAGATAFVHRDALASIQYSANWDRQASPAVAEANRAWLAEAQAALRPFVSGFAYQNYIDPDLADWRHAYYGANLQRLVDVRKRYDPDRVFRFPQGI